jgi:hypothetical protein
MDQLTNEPPTAVVQTEEITMNNLDKLIGRINQLQESLEKVSGKFKHNRIWQRLVRSQLAYIATAKILRSIVSSTIGIRVGGVLIGAALFAGFMLVLAHSWIAFFCGLILGAVLFLCFLYLPADERIPGKIQELEIQTAECQAIEDEHNRLADQIAEAKKKLRQIIESQQYRLQKLLNRNWKAMRGGELEQFLEEVFTELRYVVERTGGAGDQGVDLILAKDGYRIAIQVKGYLDSVPNTAIQEAFTGMTYHKCVGCAVITNSRFTSGGKNVAQAVGCVLIDEDTLPNLIMGRIDLWQMILTARS